MEPIIEHIDIEELSYPSASVQRSGKIDMDSYTIGAHTFGLDDGIDYDVVLTNTGEGILVTGVLKCQAAGQCDRCLEPVRLDISAAVDEYYMFEEPEDDAEECGECEDDIQYRLVSADKTIDLSEALMQALVMETPFVILCDEDCKGLCPRCGQNLNEGSCDCEEKLEQQKLDESPFAALKNLKLEE